MKDGVRARYTLEFKQEAVRLVRGGEQLSAAARTLGVSAQSLDNWVKAEAAGRLRDVRGKALTTEQMEIARLKAELSRVRMERDILKNAQYAKNVPGRKTDVSDAAWLQRLHSYGLALKLIGECGTYLSAWPGAKHFTSWLCLAPGNKISGGKLLSLKTRRSSSRAAALLRLAAVTLGRGDTALGAFYRRISALAGKAKAMTATARKIAVLFYNSLRHGMKHDDPGAMQYEERYRSRVIANLRRRAKTFGFSLEEISGEPDMGVS